MTEVTLSLEQHHLAAALRVPPHAKGSIVFVHGSGVDHRDARERHVARRLGQAGLATLQPELLEPWQRRERHNAFDTELQCARLLEALRWIEGTKWGRALPVGLYATGIGAGVALLAAALRPARIGAVVCRSGRPDGALFWLAQVRAPTLFIVDQPDWCNEAAYDKLAAEKELAIVPSPSHRFEERPALDAVAQRAWDWFARHLLAPPA